MLTQRHNLIEVNNVERKSGC